jgi:hypothetical protein
MLESFVGNSMAVKSNSFNVEDVLSKLNVDEKVALLSGAPTCTRPIS